MPAPVIPLADSADAMLRRLARATNSRAIAALDGATLLGERAMLAGFAIPADVSAGGGCRLYPARDGAVALNLARRDDRALLPALFECDAFDPDDDAAVAALIAERDEQPLVARARMMGLAIAGESDPPAGQSTAPLRTPPITRATRPPRVLDLSALWAGPLAGHLLWLAGAEVIKVESLARPDAMRADTTGFFALLNQGKASVTLDFSDPADHAALLYLIARSDIVIEAARPRALAQLGIDADAIVKARPGLVWLTITAHGMTNEAANWVGFGDDIGVSAGLSARLRAASGQAGFGGDAIADPLSGIHAASVAWSGWQSGCGGRYAITMRDVVAECIDGARGLDATLRTWRDAAGTPVPADQPRAIGTVAAWGADTRRLLASAGC